MVWGGEGGDGVTCKPGDASQMEKTTKHLNRPGQFYMFKAGRHRLQFFLLFEDAESACPFFSLGFLVCSMQRVVAFCSASRMPDAQATWYSSMASASLCLAISHAPDSFVTHVAAILIFDARARSATDMMGNYQLLQTWLRGMRVVIESILQSHFPGSSL